MAHQKKQSVVLEILSCSKVLSRPLEMRFPRSNFTSSVSNLGEMERWREGDGGRDGGMEGGREGEREGGREGGV